MIQHGSPLIDYKKFYSAMEVPTVKERFFIVVERARIFNEYKHKKSLKLTQLIAELKLKNAEEELKEEKKRKRQEFKQELCLLIAQQLTQIMPK